MRRFAFLALAAAAACNETSKLEPGPGDQFYFPTGIGVHERKLVVASSNFDLRFDDATGGTVIAVDPLVTSVPLAGTLNIQSFAGQMAIADPSVCPMVADAMALVPARGVDQLYRIRIGDGGALSCDRCSVPLGTAEVTDPFSVGVACEPGMARAYVGYLRSNMAEAFLTQVDLTKGALDPTAVQTLGLDTFGQVRAFAYDSTTKRLFFTRTGTGAAATLDWIDLSGGCDLAPAEGGLECHRAATAAGAFPRGLELRGLALSTPDAAFPQQRRVYLTARQFDDTATTAAGAAADLGGVLLVADLVEGLSGQLEVRIVRQISIGYGAGDVVRLPPRPGQRDVVVTVAADDGVLWIYDDDTGALLPIGRDLTRPEGGAPPTGAPLVGHVPFGLAVDPVTETSAGGEVAHVYVGSFEDNYVTRIDVPLAAPASASIVSRIIPGGTP